MSSAERVLVLMYHRVGEVRDAAELRYCIPPQRFAAQMKLLADKGYRAVPLDALVDWLSGGPALPPGAFVLTFDDGFRGVLDHAVPVLERLDWPFTVFLVSDLLGGVDEWTGKGNPDAATYPLLTANEVLAMHRRGGTFHSHTCTHASLPALDDAALEHQLRGSRESLASLLGHGVDYLAYPYGHVDERVEAAVRVAGYRAALSVQPGFNRGDVNPLRIRRLDVAGTDSPAVLLRKMHLGSNDGSLGRTLSYYTGRIARRLTARTA